MQERVYDSFRDVVYEATGINLGPRKQALVAARIGKRMRALGLTDHDEYLARVAADESGLEMTLLIDSICTNVTSFFREQDHFGFVRQAVAEQKAAGQDRFRIWSAACSTGEEVYSLAITLEDLAADGCDIRILGTDLSTKALRVALAGTYPTSKVSGVHPDILKRCFRKSGKGDAVSYAVKPHLRAMTVFRQVNLSRPPFALNGPLDIVLCRNVMIYFDKPVRDGLLTEMRRLIKPGGYLSVGHAETLTGAAGFKPLQPSIYERC